MNTLKDTLNDLFMDAVKSGRYYAWAEKGAAEENKKAILEEYLQRIINELNIKKYFQ